MVESQIDQLHQDSLGQCSERSLVSEFAIWTQKWMQIAAAQEFVCRLCDSLLIGIGQDQQQHPAVHTGGVSRGRVCACGWWH